MKGCNFLFAMLLGAIIGAVGLFSSCSIKEDRSECPCWMTVGLSDIGDLNYDEALLLMRGNSSDDAVNYEFSVTERIDLSGSGFTNEYEVPRGAVGVSAFLYGDRAILSAASDILEIPIGNQMDSLYGYFKMFDTRRETVSCEIKLHKEFCTVYLIIGSTDYECPYTVETHGNVSGISTFNMLPVEGDFIYSPTITDGQYVFRIPRQFDNSLTVVLKKGDEVVDTLPLGEYIAKSGYDWSGADLADISITVDIPQQQVLISVSGWENIIVMDIVI